MQFRGIPVNASNPFRTRGVGSALRQAVACYLSSPASLFDVRAVSITSVRFASSGRHVGEPIKAGEGANSPPTRRGCEPPAEVSTRPSASRAAAPPSFARRLAGHADAAVTAAGRRLQAAPSPRSDEAVNVFMSVNVAASDGEVRALLAAASAPDGSAAFTRFLQVCGFYDALLEWDPALPITQLSTAAGLVEWLPSPSASRSSTGSLSATATSTPWVRATASPPPGGAAGGCPRTGAVPASLRGRGSPRDFWVLDHSSMTMTHGTLGSFISSYCIVSATPVGDLYSGWLLRGVAWGLPPGPSSSAANRTSPTVSPGTSTLRQWVYYAARRSPHLLLAAPTARSAVQTVSASTLIATPSRLSSQSRRNCRRVPQ